MGTDDRANDAADVDGRTTDELKPDLWDLSSQLFGASRGAEIGRESVGAEALGRGRAGIKFQQLPISSPAVKSARL